MNPFFVVGSDRSGTTMLRLMLNEHSRMHVPPESWFLSDLMDRFPSTGALSTDQVDAAVTTVVTHWRWPDWEIAPDAVREEVARARPDTLAGVVDCVYRVSAGAKSRWGDKSPGYAREITRLHGLFPTAKFVHVFRDGRDVCLSLLRTGWRGGVAWSGARYWAEHVTIARAQGRRLDRSLYLEIAYEQLVLETEASLRRICEFLGEAFEPSMVEFHTHAAANVPTREHSFHQKTFRAPRPQDIQRWRHEISPVRLLLVEAIAGSTLTAFGYHRALPRATTALRPVIAAAGLLARATLPLRKRLNLHFPRLRRLV